MIVVAALVIYLGPPILIAWRLTMSNGKRKVGA